MRILLLSPAYHGGGAERCARELFDAWRQRGHHVEMWTRTTREGDPPGIKSIRLPNVPVINPLFNPISHLPFINDWQHIGSRVKLSKITRQDFDVVHLHNLHSNWLSIKAVRDMCKRLPVVWTLHDEWAVTGGMPYDLTRVLDISEVQAIQNQPTTSKLVPLYANARANRTRRFLEKHMPEPNAIVTPSRWLAKLAQETPLLKGVSVHCIPNGLSLLDEPEIDLSMDQARTRYNLPTDTPIILLVAASVSSPFKGMTLAVDAQAALDRMLASGAVRPHVLLLGKDSDNIASKIREQARLQVTQAWAGTSAELAAAYRAVDFTLLPSIADNFPYVALESLACSRPICTFNVGGLPEIVGNQEHGASVPCFDIQAMADVMKQWLDCPDVPQTLGRNGRQWVEEHLTMNAYCDKLMSLYEKIAQ